MPSLSTQRHSSQVGSAYAFHTHTRSFSDQQVNSRQTCETVLEVFETNLASRLAELKIPESAAYILAIAPLAHVAWSAGTLTRSKRDFALKAASLHGIPPESASYQLLRQWLIRRPDSSLFSVWHDYVGALRWVLSEEDLNTLRTSTLERCRAILRATSSCFGLAAQTDLEHKLLQKVMAAF